MSESLIPTKPSPGPCVPGAGGGIFYRRLCGGVKNNDVVDQMSKFREPLAVGDEGDRSSKRGVAGDVLVRGLVIASPLNRDNEGTSSGEPMGLDGLHFI